MSVIINELEVVLEAPEEATPEQPAGAPDPAMPPMLAPMDVNDIFGWYEQRRSRLRAH